MIITRISPLTGKINSHDLNISQDQLDQWQYQGAMIQNVFPHLSEDEREFIQTGLDFGEFDDLADQWEKNNWTNSGYKVGQDNSKPTDNSPPIIIDSLPPFPKEWEILEEDPIQAADEREAADNEWVEESTPKKDKVEKVYSPPSSKIYSTTNISYHKFHKVRPVYKYLNSNIYLAGGSLRTVLKCAAEDVNDFDLFFKNLDEVQPLYDRLLKDEWVLTYSCPDGYLYSFKRGKHKIQLICEVEYDSPNVLLNSFDISSCLFCWHDGTFYFAREAVRSVFTKKLRINNVSFPVATLKRLVKYVNKGYSLGESAEDFCRLVSQGNIDSWDFRHYID